jgi:ABC-type multidrug transport system fused ATPase/permease subunit
VRFQDVALLDDTVAANLKLGRPDASDEEMMLAASAAGAHTFITALPAGYQTLIGDRGLFLSRGERQRPAAAGAVLNHAARTTEFAVAAVVVLAAALALRVGLASAAGSRVRRALKRARRARARRRSRRLERIPGRRLREIDPGRVVATLTTGLDEAIGIYGDAFEAIFGGISTALLILVLLAFIDWRIALVALAFAPLTAGYLWQSRAISGRAAPRLVRARAEGTSRFFEYVESVALLRTFGRTAERRRAFGLGAPGIETVGRGKIRARRRDWRPQRAGGRNGAHRRRGTQGFLRRGPGANRDAGF